MQHRGGWEDAGVEYSYLVSFLTFEGISPVYIYISSVVLSLSITCLFCVYFRFLDVVLPPEAPGWPKILKTSKNMKKCVIFRFHV